MATQFAVSLAAVSLLVLLSWKFGFTGRPELASEHEARAIGNEIAGGFAAVEVAIDRSAHAALLQDGDGRIVLVIPAGAHFVPVLLGPDASASAEEGRLEVRHGRLLTVLDLGGAAGDWADAIARLG